MFLLFVHTEHGGEGIGMLKEQVASLDETKNPERVRNRLPGESGIDRVQRIGHCHSVRGGLENLRDSSTAALGQRRRSQRMESTWI
jgi:hypothetical protein